MSYLLLIICSIMFAISTFGYIKLIKVQDKKEGILIGIILYFFRIIVFSLILGMIIRRINCITMTIVSMLELGVVFLIFKIKKKNLFKILKKELISIKLNKKINFNFYLTLIFIIVFIVIGIIALFIYEYSFDGNYYHLPHIIDYIQNESIYITNNTIWNNVYPQNIELLNMFFMMFSKSIYFARIPQIVFSIAGMLAVYLILKELKIDKKYAYRASLLYFVSPFILAQLTTTYIDGIGISMFMILLYALIKIINTNELKYEILYFLTLSIFMGTKGTYVIYAIIMSVIYIIFKIIQIVQKKEKLKNVLLKWLVFLIIVISIGCTWMIQNIILFGNPIHPFEFIGKEGLNAKIDIGIENEPYSIRGKNHFEKIITSWIGLKSSFLEKNNIIGISNLFQTHDSRIGGLGINWTYFLLPCIIVAFILIILKKYKLSKEILLITGIISLCFLLTPANWWGRYVGFILIVGFIAYGIVCEFIKNKYLKISINIWYSMIFILSIIFSSKFAVKIFINGKYYEEINQDIVNYVNQESQKDIVLLEESYYNTNYITMLKGNKFQNKVDTYFIKEMYPNEIVKNHNIGTYNNFEKIDKIKKGATIVILDAASNRENKKFTEKYYNYNKELYNKIQYGDDIIVYERINK